MGSESKDMVGDLLLSALYQFRLVAKHCDAHLVPGDRELDFWNRVVVGDECQD